VNAIYVFDVEGEGKWHVDMTSGSGSVGEGDPPKKPDVTVVVNKENFLKVMGLNLPEYLATYGTE
jgi:SCP-2 sterol transfer family